jgi:DNA-binding CsgD family transcriptional regulator
LLLAAVAAWRGEDPGTIAPLVDRGWDAGRVLVGAGSDLWAVGQGLAALVVNEQYDHCDRLCDALLADARARGSVVEFVLGTALRGFAQARLGRLAVAEGLLRGALDPARENGFHFAVPWFLWIATDVILERPEAADLVSLTLTQLLGPMEELLTGALLLDVRGRVRDLSGDPDAAVGDLERAGAIFTALGMRNPAGSNWRSAVALMVTRDDPERARRLVADELEDARRIGRPRGIGVALRTLGLIEGGTPGRRLLERAVATLEPSPAKLEYARALVELGAAMRRSGERTAARAPLRAGLDIALAAGAVRLGERARAELSASGAHPRRLRMTGRDALTPSELRVAHLVAEGRTNAEVAQALFVTPKTIDTHLSRSYTKLGISSRRELAEALGSGRDAGAP